MPFPCATAPLPSRNHTPEPGPMPRLPRPPGQLLWGLGEREAPRLGAGQLLLPSPHQPHSRTSPWSCWARCPHPTKGSCAIGGVIAITASATFRETFDKFLPHSTPSAPGSEAPCAFDQHRLRSASGVHATELPGPGRVRVGSGGRCAGPSPTTSRFPKCHCGLLS